MSDLLPCPFCGSRNVAQGASSDRISVWCCCGARGPDVDFPQDCIDPVTPIKECHAAWNRRAPSPSPAPGVVEALHLTEYELQVLLGTSVGGCNMSPDRVFSLDMAWHRLHAIGLIDRTDGLAIITEKGIATVATALASLSQPTKGEREGGR